MPREWLAPWQTWLALFGILLIGAHFRFMGLHTWDADTSQHPDERFIIYTVYNLQVPRSVGDYFHSACAVNGIVPKPGRMTDLGGRQLSPATAEPSLESGCNTLNPRNYGWSSFFVYGTLPTSLTRLVAEIYYDSTDHPISEQIIPPATIRNVGRTVSTLFDLASVLLVFLIATRLYGDRTGLLASLLYALAVLPIQLAHFFTVDATTGFFVLLTVYWAVRAAQNGGFFTFVALGMSTGGAMACRVTMATIGMLAIAAIVVRLWADRKPVQRSNATATQHSNTPTHMGLFTGMALLAVAGAIALLTFRLLAPDTFIGTSFFDLRPEPRFIKSITSVADLVSGKQDAPFSQQWADRTPYLFPLTNMVVWGMGLPLGIAAWLAWGAALWRMIRRREVVHLIPVLWIGFYFAWQGGQFGMTMRYYALLYGLLAILAAWGVGELVWGRTLRGVQTRLVGDAEIDAPSSSAPNPPGEQQPISEGSALLAELIAQSTSLPASEQPSAPARRSSPAGGFMAYGALTIVLVGTVLWAFAFSSIYAHPHSRITAARWVEAHVPPGATLTSEIWDDVLPFGVDGGNANAYTILKTAPYQEDDLIKYTGYVAQDGTLVPGLLDQLDQADYVILASNRVYDSATRNPMRYPALIRYYHYLFNGQLGFEQVADIHSYPTLFGIEIPDQGAEEAFSVYDHPRVSIFKKTTKYSRELATQLIMDDIAWGEVYKLPTVQVRQVPTALRLTETQWPSIRAAGTWVRLFHPQGIFSSVPWLPWLFILEAIGLATFALLFRPLRALADRGFALAKILGLLLIAYLAWLLGSFQIAEFNPRTVWLLVLPLLVAGAIATWAQRDAIREFGRTRRAALLSAEGLFLLAFLAFVALRALNPDLWHPARGGEKPMDLAFLTAVLKSASFPPYDPWFAGGYINYYYFGFVIVGVLVHLTGLEPNIAYNLAVPTLFALTALGAWGAGYNLVALHTSGLGRQHPETQRRKGAKAQQFGDARAHLFSTPAAFHTRVERRAILTGLAAAIFVALFGNLAQAYWLLPGTANHAQPLAPGWQGVLTSYAMQQGALGRAEWAFWDATRTVGYALNDGVITEFPFFTFLFGDLHAHMIALPIGIAVLGLLIGLVRETTTFAFQTHNQRSFWRSSLARLWRNAWFIGLLALATGALRATNTWDYPGYLGVSLASLGLIAWLQMRSGTRWQFALRDAALQSVVLISVGWLLFLPFTRSFATEYAGFSPWFGLRTPAAELLKTNGVWLFALISSGSMIYLRAARLGRTPVVALVVAGIVLIALSAVFGAPALIPLALLIGGALLLLFDLGLQQRVAPDVPEVGARTLVLVVWGLCGLGLTMLPELLVAKGDIGRMNTVFKFGMQSWTILALVSAVGIVWAWEYVGNRIGGRIWRVAAFVLGIAALAYPLLAIPARLADRVNPQIAPTLDGMAVLSNGVWEESGHTFRLGEDAAAIQWMRANITGTPIVLEAQTEAYRWGGRIATYTGLPTLLGWPWHVSQQRAVASVEPVLENRKQVILQIYSAIDPAESLRLLQLYGVEYLYIGQLERVMYNPAGLDRLESLARRGLLQQVYHVGQTAIYHIPAAAHPPAVLTTSLPTKPNALPNPQAATPGVLGGRVGDLPQSDPYPQFGRTNAFEQVLAIGLWLLAWLAIQILGLPVAALVFGKFGKASTFRSWFDGGYLWARPVGLILLGYAVWLPVSAGIWYYDRLGLLFGALLIIGLNLLILRRMGGLQSLLAHFWPYRIRIAQGEGLALVAFLGLLLLRAFNPDLWHPYWGGEKPFEFGLLNATLRSAVMPPYSPFYSDGTINYYYYGFFLVSLVIKATGIAPSIAFNLIVPTLFGMFVCGLFALAARISGRAWVGLAAVGLVALAGNLAAAFKVGWSAGIGPVLLALESWPGGFGKQLGSWFVGSSRVIPNTINEFPLWGFLFADLHPHLIAMPITLLAIALAWAVYEGSNTARRTSSRSGLPAVDITVSQAKASIDGICDLATYLLVALTLGTLAVTNSWDFLTYALLLTGALVGQAWRANGLRAAQSMQQHALSLLHVILAVLGAGVLAGIGLVLFLPFFRQFTSPVGGVALVKAPSDLRDLLLAFGLPLALIAPNILMAAWRVLTIRTSRVPSPVALGLVARPLDITQVPRLLIGLAAIVVVLAVLLALLPVLVPLQIPSLPGVRIWLAILLLACVPILLERRITQGTWFATWMAAVALAVMLGFEFIYVRDHLASGDWYRMNTVFKFGLQAWILLGLAAALAVPHVALGLRRAGLVAQALGWGALLALVALAAVFPLAGIPSRTAYRFDGSPVPTLDGLAFMDRSSYTIFPQYLGMPEETFAPVDISLADDGNAIGWLNANVAGSPLVIQSSAEFYRLYGIRIAANTGLPTVVSPLHEAEQRDPSDVYARDRDVGLFYRTTDQNEALRLIALYHIGYIYIGPIERIVYGEDGIAKFAAMATTAGPLSIVYQNTSVTIYRVEPFAYELARISHPAATSGPTPAQEPTTSGDLQGLERQVAAAPEDLNLAWQLAQRYSERGRYDDAAQLLGRFAREQPDDVGIQHFYGDMLLLAGRISEAEQAYRRAVTADPSPANYTKLGSALVAWGRLDEAEQVLANALDGDVLVGEPYYYLGQIAEARGQSDRAVQYYRRVLELAAPEDPLYIDAQEALHRMGAE